MADPKSRVVHGTRRQAGKNAALGQPAKSPSHPAPPTTWSVVWCHERCRKDDHDPQRQSFAVAAQNNGASFVCRKKASTFASWIAEGKQPPYVLITDWREVKPCLAAIAQHDNTNRPLLTIVLCETGVLFGRASAWAETMDLKNLVVRMSLDPVDSFFENLATYVLSHESNVSAAEVSAQIVGEPLLQNKVCSQTQHVGIQGAEAGSLKPLNLSRIEVKELCSGLSSSSSAEHLLPSYGFNQASNMPATPVHAETISKSCKEDSWVTHTYGFHRLPKRACEQFEEFKYGPSPPEYTYGASEVNRHGTPMTSPGLLSAISSNKSDDSSVMRSDCGWDTEETMSSPMCNQELSTLSREANLVERPDQKFDCGGWPFGLSHRTSTTHTPYSPLLLEVFPMMESVGHSPAQLQYESGLEFVSNAMATGDPKFIEAILNQAKPEQYEE